MSYTRITAVASFDALLGYLSTFMATLGGGTAWTLSNNLGAATVDTPGPSAAGGRVLIAYNGDCLVGLRSTVSGPGANVLYLFDGIGPYTSGNEANLNGNSGMGANYTNAGVIQAGGQSIRGFQQFTGPFPNLYMFSNAAGDYVYVVVEIQTGHFRHMAFGKLTQFGTWPSAGGGFYASTWWNQSIFISSPTSNNHTLPFDNNSAFSLADWTVHFPHSPDAWIAPGGDVVRSGVTLRKAVGSVRGGFNRFFKNFAESSFSNLIPLAPIVIGAVRTTDTPNTVRWIGRVPDMRMINMTNLTDAQEFSIGVDTWKVFSGVSKNGGATQENSAVIGFAYKKIP